MQFHYVTVPTTFSYFSGSRRTSVDYCLLDKWAAHIHACVNMTSDHLALWMNMLGITGSKLLLRSVCCNVYFSNLTPHIYHPFQAHLWHCDIYHAYGIYHTKMCKWDNCCNRNKSLMKVNYSKSVKIARTPGDGGAMLEDPWRVYCTAIIVGQLAKPCLPEM